MKRISLVVLALVGFLTLGACCTVDQDLANGMKAGYTDVIHPRYVDYVQNDPNLDEDTKVERIRTANDLVELIKEALKDGEDE